MSAFEETRQRTCREWVWQGIGLGGRYVVHHSPPGPDGRCPVCGRKPRKQRDEWQKREVQP